MSPDIFHLILASACGILLLLFLSERSFFLSERSFCNLYRDIITDLLASHQQMEQGLLDAAAMLADLRESLSDPPESQINSPE